MTGRVDAQASPRFLRRAARSRVLGRPRHSRERSRPQRGVELTDGQVIQKEERRCVADQNVVHAVVDEVAPDAAVALQFGRDEHLRADAVGRGDQRALAVAREAKESGEAADGVELIGVAPFARECAVSRDGLIAGADVDAGFGVTVWGSGFLVRTRILPAFRHTLAVVHRPKGPPCKFISLLMSPLPSAPARSSFPSSPRARSKASRKEIDASLGGVIADALAADEVRGKLGEHVLVYAKGQPYRRVLAVSLGDRSAFEPYFLARYAGSAVRYLGRRNVEKIAIALPPPAGAQAATCASFVAEGAITGSFDTTLYQERPERRLATNEVVVLSKGFRRSRDRARHRARCGDSAKR